MSKLAEVLSEDSLYPHPERLVSFVGNHDTTRFLDAVQNEGTHTRDQSAAALRLAFAYIMTTRGMPQIYSGDELAMNGGEDPDNRRDFPGGFPEASTNAFIPDGRSAEQQQMYAWVSQLAALRRTHPALACGAEQILASNDEWMVYARDSGHVVNGTCIALPILAR